MPDDEVVGTYLDAVAASPDASDEAIGKILLAAGFSELLVSQAVRFIPIAFGRALMDGMGIRFSPTYVLLSGEGQLVERGVLDSLVVYKTAQTATLSRPDAMKTVALRSAETNAVNSALNGGSNPGDLAMAPVVAFTESATDRGAVRAQKLLQSMLEDIRREESQLATPATSKPRWKLW